MCDECYCEHTVKHGLEIVFNAVKGSINSKLHFWYYHWYLKPKQGRENLRIYGTKTPTFEQVIAKSPKLLVPVYVDAQIVEMLRKTTTLTQLIPRKEKKKKRTRHVRRTSKA